MTRSWEAIEDEAERVVAEHSATLNSRAAAQIREFLRLIRGRTPVPEVGPGYWHTSVRVTWSDYEVEVFDNRLEVYRFPEKQVDVRYFWHLPGEPFAPDFLAELDSLRA